MLRDTPIYLLGNSQTVKGSSPLDHPKKKSSFLVYGTVKDLSVQEAELIFRGVYSDMKVVKLDGLFKADQIELTDQKNDLVTYEIKTVHYHRNKTIFYIYTNKVSANG